VYAPDSLSPVFPSPTSESWFAMIPWAVLKEDLGWEDPTTTADIEEAKEDDNGSCGGEGACAGELSDAESARGYGVPRLSYLEIFAIFLNFGLRAWGGPAAHLAILKEQFVVQGR
jgi:hypothetical protein